MRCCIIQILLLLYVSFDTKRIDVRFQMLQCRLCEIQDGAFCQALLVWPWVVESENVEAAKFKITFTNVLLYRHGCIHIHGDQLCMQQSNINPIFWFVACLRWKLIKPETRKGSRFLLRVVPMSGHELKDHSNSSHFPMECCMQTCLCKYVCNRKPCR